MDSQVQPQPVLVLGNIATHVTVEGEMPGEAQGDHLAEVLIHLGSETDNFNIGVPGISKHVYFLVYLKGIEQPPVQVLVQTQDEIPTGL